MAHHGDTPSDGASEAQAPTPASGTASEAATPDSDLRLLCDPRCQNQLKAKEEEMGRQSEYFHHFKTQLQHKLRLSRDREQLLQGRVHALERQLLDAAVSTATNMTAGRTTTAGSCFAVTPRSAAPPPGEERVPCLREEGEGEEGGEMRRRRRRWRRRRRRSRRKRGGGRGKDGRRGLGACQGAMEGLRSFILGLQEDLRALLEREEKGLAERRGLSEQLQEAQESGHLLGCRLEEKGAEVLRLQHSESTLLEELEELREENDRLKRDLRAAVGTQTPAGLSPLAGFVPPVSPRPRYCPTSADLSLLGLPNSPAAERERAVCPSTVGNSGEVAAESSLNPKDHRPASADPDAPLLPQPDLLNLSASLDHKAHPGLGVHRLATETTEVGELNVEEWCSRGALHLEESPGEVADALLEAYRSLGMGADQNNLHQEQLVGLAQDNAQLKSQRARGPGSSQGKDGGGVTTQDASFDHDCVDYVPSSPGQDHALPAPAVDDLVQALNRENRALAERIQELLSHMDLREDKRVKEAARWTERVSRLTADVARREREQQEHGGLITELTRKTEDDLNTIMELQQRLTDKEESDTYECGGDDAFTVSARGSGPHGIKEGSMGLLMDHPSQADDDGLPETCRHLSHSAATDSAAKLPQDCAVDNGVLAHSQAHALTESVWKLQEEEGELAVSVGSLREEQREVSLAVQTQTEDKQRLTRTLWVMKEERDGLTQALGALKLEREQLTRTVCGLRDERDQLREERGHLGKALSELKEERETLSKLPSVEEGERVPMKSQDDIFVQSESYFNLDNDGLTGSSGALKEQGDLERMVWTQILIKTQRFGSELCESEARLGDMERTAAEADREKMRLTDLLEDTRHETDLLTTRVKDLQNRLTGLAREKDEALSLRGHLEEQFSILQAQLRAKTVALDELNSEYAALRREQGSREEAALGSLRTRYNDIRTKYDVLLKKKSQTDLDLAPLKAKLSCLVLKCQERNGLLVQMMRAMRRPGCMDHALTQQVENLLSDTALQDYTTAFAPTALGLEEARLQSARPPSERRSGLTRRLSSPEKILNLQQELQRTLSSISKVGQHGASRFSLYRCRCFGRSPRERPPARPEVTFPAAKVTGKLERPKPGAPGPVGSVEVIRTVGRSSLLIGWERPPLDELGCSQGTFVYVDGEFHKSVMSSACTKCILENVDLSLPVHIGVQTLGSNGLSSDRLSATYRTSLVADPSSPGTAAGGGPPERGGVSLSPSPDHSTSPPLRLLGHDGLSPQVPLMESFSNPTRSQPSSPGTQAKRALRCMAISSYSPLRDSPHPHPSRELALRQGDTVTLLGQPRPDGFCEAQVNARRGLAPMVCLEEIPESCPLPFPPMDALP
ncbi:hypothetical protein NHX12_010780 [Muraenolepis orangiensis]|uniref:SH3 domain-containing protein n=1 Tax=Muraenolepis orangiensis TaxID=630683 RepID=A0A9Q0DF67_9TELE|nr:hypothetical protein NHX12_010780 [Muraenolepis orangiensis]